MPNNIHFIVIITVSLNASKMLHVMPYVCEYYAENASLQSPQAPSKCFSKTVHQLATCAQYDLAYNYDKGRAVVCNVICLPCCLPVGIDLYWLRDPAMGSSIISDPEVYLLKSKTTCSSYITSLEELPPCIQETLLDCCLIHELYCITTLIPPFYFLNFSDSTICVVVSFYTSFPDHLLFIYVYCSYGAICGHYQPFF